MSVSGAFSKPYATTPGAKHVISKLERTYSIQLIFSSTRELPLLREAQSVPIEQAPPRLGGERARRGAFVVCGSFSIIPQTLLSLVICKRCRMRDHLDFC